MTAVSTRARCESDDDLRVLHSAHRFCGRPRICIQDSTRSYQYTKDYNDSFGYLVVFKTCREDLSVITHAIGTPAFRFLPTNNKTIFVLVIDIFDYPAPASKRGRLKSYELLEENLVRTISDSTPAKSRPGFSASRRLRRAPGSLQIPLFARKISSSLWTRWSCSSSSAEARIASRHAARWRKRPRASSPTIRCRRSSAGSGHRASNSAP